MFSITIRLLLSFMINGDDEGSNRRESRRAMHRRFEQEIDDLRHRQQEELLNFDWEDAVDSGVYSRHEVELQELRERHNVCILTRDVDTIGQPDSDEGSDGGIVIRYGDDSLTFHDNGNAESLVAEMPALVLGGSYVYDHHLVLEEFSSSIHGTERSRFCWRCGSEVFTYFNNLYWCQHCFENTDIRARPVVNEDLLFGGRLYMADAIFLFEIEGCTLRNLVERVHAVMLECIEWL
jgi:hypothetical protein